jgi:arylsulfatase A-like enzyme
MKVLVIVADGLHLGYVGCYGNNWVATAALDRLAAEGVTFDQHYADCPNATGAHRAWRTGRYQLPGSADEQQPATELPGDLLALLQGGGIPTCLVVNQHRPELSEFAAGWDRVVPVLPARRKGTAMQRTQEAVKEALDYCAPLAQWLLWIELPSLLPPWQIPADILDQHFPEATEENEEGDAGEEAGPAPLPWCDPVPGPLDAADKAAFGRLQCTYAAAVANLNAGLEALLEELRQQHRTDDLLILFTTDHGLPLGEHGVLGAYRPWLHDELVHVPLMIRLPGGAEAGRRVPALTQDVDLMPTLLDAFGVPVPAAAHGHTLLPLLWGKVDMVRRYACGGLQIGERIEWALRTLEWGFLCPVRGAAEDPPRSAQLYVKPDDRWEVNNVLQHHFELADHFQHTLSDFVKATRLPGPLQPPALRDIELEAAGSAQPVGSAESGKESG